MNTFDKKNTAHKTLYDDHVEDDMTVVMTDAVRSGAAWWTQPRVAECCRMQGSKKDCGTTK